MTILELKTNFPTIFQIYVSHCYRNIPEDDKGISYVNAEKGLDWKSSSLGFNFWQNLNRKKFETLLNDDSILEPIKLDIKRFLNKISFESINPLKIKS